MEVYSKLEKIIYIMSIDNILSNIVVSLIFMNDVFCFLSLPCLTMKAHNVHLKLASPVSG